MVFVYREYITSPLFTQESSFFLNAESLVPSRKKTILIQGDEARVRICMRRFLKKVYAGVVTPLAVTFGTIFSWISSRKFNYGCLVYFQNLKKYIIFYFRYDYSIDITISKV